jgi:hypothetical protein
MLTANIAGTTMTFPAELTVMHCGRCGGIYAINERYRQKKEETAGGWHCPYCQNSWGYFGKTEAQRERALRKQAEDRLIRERAAFDQRAEYLKTQATKAEAKRRAEKGAKTKLKKRIANGVCPCCNRHFGNVQRHIAHMHPEFSATADLPETSIA